MKRTLTLLVISAALSLAGCAQQPVLGPEVTPQIVKIERYEYPYEGLRVELDPKGYTEFVYTILPTGEEDRGAGAGNKEWSPVDKHLVLDFTPKAWREWTFSAALRHPDGGKPTVIKQEFSVGLPPWHKERPAEPIEFSVEVIEECMRSRKEPRMPHVQTVVGYAMKIVDLPAGLDRKRFSGFSSTIPEVRFMWEGEERISGGRGGGTSESLDKPLYFGGNYELGLKPYPDCNQLADLRAADWSTVNVYLLDNYLFPVGYTKGRVVSASKGKLTSIETP